MNVGELKEMLKKYPDDMQILTDRCSDYEFVEEDQWSVIKAVPQDHWVMRSHPTMHRKHKNKERSFLHLAGN